MTLGTPLQISGKDLGALAMKGFCPRCFWISRRTRLPWQIFTRARSLPARCPALEGVGELGVEPGGHAESLRNLAVSWGKVLKIPV